MQLALLQLYIQAPPVLSDECHLVFVTYSSVIYLFSNAVLSICYNFSGTGTTLMSSVVKINAKIFRANDIMACVIFLADFLLLIHFETKDKAY